MIITVTTHAIRRYIERVEGFRGGGDDETAISRYLALTGLREGQIVERMLSEVDGRVPHRSFVTGATHTVRGKTARFVIVAGAIVTVYTDEDRGSRKEYVRPRKRRY